MISQYNQTVPINLPLTVVISLYLQSFSQKIISVKLVVSYDVIVELSIVTSKLKTNFTLTIFCEKGYWNVS